MDRATQQACDAMSLSWMETPRTDEPLVLAGSLDSPSLGQILRCTCPRAPVLGKSFFRAMWHGLFGQQGALDIFRGMFFQE